MFCRHNKGYNSNNKKCQQKPYKSHIYLLFFFWMFNQIVSTFRCLARTTLGLAPSSFTLGLVFSRLVVMLFIHFYCKSRQFFWNRKGNLRSITSERLCNATAVHSMFKFMQLIVHKLFNIVHRIGFACQNLFMALAQYLQQCSIIINLHMLRTFVFDIAKIE